MLDWLMPNLDGRGFLERAAADPELGSIPIIVYSALGGRVLARDVAAIVSKAEDPDVLLDVVARLAERGS